VTLPPNNRGRKPINHIRGLIGSGGWFSIHARRCVKGRKSSNYIRTVHVWPNPWKPQERKA
jgi:hypothetical protein